MRILWLIGAAWLGGTAVTHAIPHAPDGVTRRCSQAPGTTLALLEVERDTTLQAPVVSPELRVSGRGPAMISSDMPAARVRLLGVDSLTRDTLAVHGVTAGQPTAYIRAAPYGSDCRPVPWSRVEPFVMTGEVGYVRGWLAPRAQWIGNVPLIVIPEAWQYPYPRRAPRFGLADTVTLAPARDMFSLQVAIDMPGRPEFADRETARLALLARRDRALAWARENAVVAEMEPLRTDIRRAVLDPDFERARAIPSRLRGTYRVEMTVDGTVYRWFFRTVPTPAYQWRNRRTVPTTAELVRSPHIVGYQLVGCGGDSTYARRCDMDARGVRPSLVWLAAADRPTTPNEEARGVLHAELQYMLRASPESTWNAVEPFITRMSAADSISYARMTGGPLPRRDQQPVVPITLRLDGRGGVGAESTYTYTAGGADGMRTHRLTIRMTRLDTLTMPSRF